MKSINKKLHSLIETLIHPIVLKQGYRRNKVKNYWRWDLYKDQSLSSFALGMVGESLSDFGISNSLSIAVLYGIWYEYIPSGTKSCKPEKIRIENFHLFQYLHDTNGLQPSRWSIEEKPDNLENIITNISSGFENTCFPWLEMVRDPEKALDYIDSTYTLDSILQSLGSCAMYLARKTGDGEREKKYRDELQRQFDDFKEIYTGSD